MVVTAVQFDSSTDDEHVYGQTRKAFSKYEDLQSEFLKAFDDDLLNPGAEKAEYKTMKHIAAGQGPVSIGSTKRLLLDDDYDIDDNNVERECSTEQSSLKLTCDVDNNDIDLLPSASTKANRCPIQLELKVCPIYFKRFPVSDIESHAAVCAIKLDHD